MCETCLKHSALFLTFVMFYLKSSSVFVKLVNIRVPGLCWAADAKLAGGEGSPWRHDSSSPAGGFAESHYVRELLVHTAVISPEIVSNNSFTCLASCL